MSDSVEPAGLDFGALLQQAQAMQEQMVAAQEAQAAQVVTGTAGGGKVSIEMTGGGQFVSVSIAPDVVDPDDVELLEELVLAALHNATSQVADLQQEAMGGIDLGGLDLGGLLGGS
ncbi:MAG: YbaB/EbfC family nucleoid-associated protein [Acidimicrobiales bacterium]